jgi:hypothetical protein
MIDFAMTLMVVILLAGISAAVATRMPRSVRPLLALGLAEYMLCTAAQFTYTRYVYKGGDAILYADTGRWMATVLDANFGLAGPEVVALLFQRESMFDPFVYGGGGGNTGSMYAASALLHYALQGSTYAASTLVAGLAFLGGLATFAAFHDAHRSAPPRALFAAVVLFPSTAFWTSALHKEAFGVFGIGLVVLAWRALYQGNAARLLVCAPLGVITVFLFRAPALAPIFVGFVIFLVLERVQKARGPQAALVGPAYVAVGLLALLLGMVVLTRAAPALALDRLGGTVADQQQKWSLVKATANFGVEEGAPTGLGAQIVRVPLALLNALFRPQLFDVHNVTALVSAVEMTAISVATVRMLVRSGPRNVLRAIQGSPFLAMCAVTTFIGCTFVGLVTLNFGSLARYRVPFLPFYGSLLVGLAYALSARQQRAGATAPRTAAADPRRARPRAVRVRASTSAGA